MVLPTMIEIAAPIPVSGDTKTSVTGGTFTRQISWERVRDQMSSQARVPITQADFSVCSDDADEWATFTYEVGSETWPRI